MKSRQTTRGGITIGDMNDKICGGTDLENMRAGGSLCSMRGGESQENDIAPQSTTVEDIGECGEGIGVTSKSPQT